MNWQDIWLRLRALITRNRVEHELDEELQFHLAMQTRKNLAAGMTPEDASRRAGFQFGGMQQAKEECRDTRGISLIETSWRDIRYALRGFRRTPGFALTVVATIALGLGLNTTVFTVFNAYVLRPLSVHDPYSLYRFGWMNRNEDRNRFTWQEFQDFRGQNPAFSDVIGFARLYFVRFNGHILFGNLVTGNYFRMLGMNAALGRTLLPNDVTVPGSAPVAVISHKAWKNKFGSDPEIVGKKIVIHGASLEVVGVAREGLNGLGEIPLDFWAPLTMYPQLEAGPSLFGPQQPDTILIVGRLKHGWNLRQAEAALTTWAQQITMERPAAERATRVVLHSEATTIPLEPMVIAIFSPIIVSFGLVLLIACANVANMMLARAMARQREIGIRLAIGAGRSRIIRQLLTESVLLALPAALAGFVISQLTIDWCQRLIFATVPSGYHDFINPLPLQPDARVFAFMLAAAVSSALLFGLAPAIQATRSNVMQAARGEFTTDFRPARLRNALVIGQVAVSVVLLTCAVVLLRANSQVQTLDVGLQTRGVVLIDMPDQVDTQDRFRPKILQQLDAEPAVESIAAASKSPLFGLMASMPVATDAASQTTRVRYLYASPEYFPLFDIPLLRGRSFTAEEARAGSPVAVVSQATAQVLWPGGEALGQSLRIERESQRANDLMRYRAGAPPYAAVRVIGIARDAVNGYVGDGTDRTCVYLPTNLQAYGNVLFVRVRGDAEVALRRLDSALDAAVPGAVDQIHTMDEILAVQRYPFRAAYWVSSAIGGLALLLTLSGIYGVLSYLVTQRTKEIGIRVALGASVSNITALVLRQSLKFTAIGIAIGVIAAVGVHRLLASQLEMFMFDTIDGMAFTSVTLLIIAAAAGASFFPSRRAARIEPVTTLRYD